MFSELLHILYFIVYLYLAISTLYFLVFAIAGNFKKQKPFHVNAYKNRIAILIPAYREDEIIVDTAKKALDHNYPESLFRVIIIADSLSDQTIDNLKRLPLEVLHVKFDISTKAKSLHAALQILPTGQFDIVVLLDADNVMSNGCLEKINDAVCWGRKAVQCHRVAKNEDGPVAILGAASEEININLFRRGQVALGFSAAPLGSGMGFTLSLFKEIFNNEAILENVAEDREIDIQLLKKNVFMDFIDDAFVYDEKVANTRVFEKQRIRWFEAQWNHFQRFFKSDMMQEPKTAAYFNKLFQTLVLPRLLYFSLYGLILFFFVVSWLSNIEFVFPSIRWWLACLAIYVFVLLLSIPRKLFNIKLLKAMAYIPALMVFMLKAIFKMKKNRKDFLHTSKTFVEK